MIEGLSDRPDDSEKLHQKLIELSHEFGMRAVVDAIVAIDNEAWRKKLEPVEKWTKPDSPFTIRFDKATDEL